ncbi:UDP-N-acetylglucosamine 2-epimerase (non-hydrolyzing) [Methanococcoides sp. SA1]|nr:UDP-N-acetylglucosamine 2-epimerase (non-hydrolyzing) [Methanococcoides sp. SA1]
MKIAIVLGTRPEIIKMAPIIRELQDRSADFITIHTNQHYSYEMDKIFFEELDLPMPDFNLNVGSGTHGKQTGQMLIELENAFLKTDIEIVLVQGDTNTVLAGALAASKLGVTVGHVEAGLRSYDRTMPEEINRVLVDHISDYLFVPTKIAKNNLIKEGITENKIFVVGNTIVDSVFQNLKISKEKTNTLEKLNVKEPYILITSHRQENVDSPDKLKNIIRSLQIISEQLDCKIIYPIHPRTKKKLYEFKLYDQLVAIKNLKLMEPVGFLDFLQLESSSKLIITDSGGLQEEGCILNVPCVTLRENTERPETIEVGSNLLAGTDPDKIMECVRSSYAKENHWKNPFGDGQTAKRIIDIISGI